MVELKRMKSAPQPIKVLMFGEGNFLRAFAAVAVQQMNDSKKFNGAIVALQGMPQGNCKIINQSGGVYTVYERGIMNGSVWEKPMMIDVLEKCINPYENYAEYLEQAKNPHLKAIISNTTEFGITYLETELKNQESYSNYPAKLTDFLYKRFTHFKGDIGYGLAILACELIDRNGDKLKEIVKRYATKWQLGQNFENWLDSSCIFANTLVDRIVSGYPENADEIFNKLGFIDNLLDVCEPFMLWAIEADQRLDKMFPIMLCENVVITDDLEKFRTRKVRILNGAHTLSVLAGHLSGFNTVDQLVGDKYFFNLIKRALNEEIIPSMQGSDLKKYAEDVIERFKNPHLKHKLLSISLNSVSKFKARVLPSIIDYTEKFGKVPEILSFSLAALIAFYKQEIDKNANDDAKYIQILKSAFKSKDYVKTIMQNKQLWDFDLTKISGFFDKVWYFSNEINSSGVMHTVRSFLNE